MSDILLLCVTMICQANQGVTSKAVCLVEDGELVAGLAELSVGNPAAERLVSVLRRVTGPDLSAGRAGVTLCVGRAAAEQAGVDLESFGLGEEGYVILADTSKVVIAGLNDRSTDYAVSTFLERCAGVRWYWPGELGTVIPKRSAIAVPAGQVVERPAFWIRWVGNDAEWAKRNKLNVVANENVGLRFKWFVHTWLNLVPATKYAEEHPKYYALIDGKRKEPSQHMEGGLARPPLAHSTHAEAGLRPCQTDRSVRDCLSARDQLRVARRGVLRGRQVALEPRGGR